MRPPFALTPWRALIAAGAGLLLLVIVAAFAFRDDILRAAIDPKTPYQTYTPPRAPDWSKASGWALLPPDPQTWTAVDGPADVFFIHPTTYDGARQWNAPMGDERSQDLLRTVMLPNYAGPFAPVGRVFAPQYREATLFALMTFREDASEARQFAYHDVREAFRAWRRQWDKGRPLVLVGAREGALLAARLLHDEIAGDPALRRRLAAVYLIDEPVPADAFGAGAPVPACTAPAEPRCVLGWTQIIGSVASHERRLDHAAYWSADGELTSLKARPLLCVNPILGEVTDALAPKRLNRGAANATGLEWGARPGFLSREVSAQCVDGLLRVSRPASASLQPSGSWADRRKAPGFNLFFADLEADAQARVRSLTGLADVSTPAAPITTSVMVQDRPVHRIPGR